MKYQAVVFDLDGTLTDSVHGVIRSTRYALEKMNWPVPDDKMLRGFLGPPLATSFMEYCGMSNAQAIEGTRLYRERYNTIGWRENAVFPGIRQLLWALKRQGAYLSVATGKPQNASERILEYFGMTDYFNQIAGPTPDDFFANKRDLIDRSLGGQNRGKTIMIGDRASDIIAAHEHGIDSVAVLFGYGSRDEMTQSRPTYLAENVIDLFDILGVSYPEFPGYFISLEGNDGCGKSTQTALLVDWMKAGGYDLVRTREPGGSEVAEKIRHLLLDRENMGMQDMTEALLYAAARAQHVRDVIMPALSNGKVVISDRYVDSSIAYQGAGRQLGMDVVEQINAPAINGCLPNVTLLLRMGAQEALHRRESASQVDRIEMMDNDFHKRVEQAFDQLAKQNPARIAPIDASGGIEDIAQRIRLTVHDKMRKAGMY